MPTYDLARFKTGTFATSRAHVPPGGLGCFEARYTPASGEMRVTVRVCARFADPSGTDVSLGAQKNFMDAFEKRVPEYWNNRYKFTLTKKGFEGIVVQPKFEVKQSRLADAHYDLKIVNRRTGNICVRTGEDPGLQQLTEAKWDPYRGKLSAQFQLKAVEASELTQAENMLGALQKPVEIAVDTTPGQGGYSMAAMERLRSHADAVNTAFQNFQETPIVSVRGPGKSGLEVARNVAQILFRFGLQVPNAKLEKNGRAGFATIELDRAQLGRLDAAVKAAISNFPQFGQYAVVHEYGHMLGLPDEYMCCGSGTVGILAQLGLGSRSTAEKEALENNTTTQQQPLTAGIAKTQEEFVKLCSAFGVPAPPFGRSNPSLMSSGHQFLPCHGTTVAHALWRMTRNYCEMKDWHIDLN